MSNTSNVLVYFKKYALIFNRKNSWITSYFFQTNVLFLKHFLNLKYTLIFYIYVQAECLYVCLGFIIPLKRFSFILRCHHYLWKAVYFDICSALMAIEHWGFFSMPHLLWHEASVYNGHLRGPVTLTHIVENSAVERSLPVFTT